MESQSEDQGRRSRATSQGWLSRRAAGAPTTSDALALLRFLVVGVANTLVGLAAIYGAMYFFGFGIKAANAFGYTIGILQSFALNRTWTFGSSDHLLASLLRYLLVLAVAYAANLAVVMLANSRFGMNPYLAQAMGILPYTAIGFLGSRHFAFRSRK